jgi:hypothetical protein
MGTNSAKMASTQNDHTPPQKYDNINMDSTIAESMHKYVSEIMNICRYM